MTFCAFKNIGCGIFKSKGYKIFFSGFKSYARCHDSNDFNTNFNISRGQSGVAILWSNKLSDKVTCLDVGNERIVAIQLEVGINICLKLHSL